MITIAGKRANVALSHRSLTTNGVFRTWINFYLFSSAAVEVFFDDIAPGKKLSKDRLNGTNREKKQKIVYVCSRLLHISPSSRLVDISSTAAKCLINRDRTAPVRRSTGNRCWRKKRVCCSTMIVDRRREIFLFVFVERPHFQYCARKWVGEDRSLIKKEITCWKSAALSRSEWVAGRVWSVNSANVLWGWKESTVIVEISMTLHRWLT